MSSPRFRRALSLCACLILGGGPLLAGPFSINVDLNEYPFPVATTNVSGQTLNYNLIRDLNGSKLVADNGDLPDVMFTFSGSSAPGASQRVEWQTTNSGRYTSVLRFGARPASNNPGDRISSQIRIEFGDHLYVTDMSLGLSSLNTAALTWEFALLSFLQPNGTYFTPAPLISPYLSHASINGSPSAGWFAADSTATVTGVGTNQTANGASGPFNNLTLTYALAGLMTGTRIGGVELTFISENVRGISNNASEVTASLIGFSMSGMMVPEPESAALMAGALAFVLWAARKRRV